MLVPQFVDKVLISAFKPLRSVPYRGKMQDPGTRQVVILSTGGSALSHPRNFDHQVTWTVWGSTPSDYDWVSQESGAIVAQLKEWELSGWIGPVPFLYLSLVSLPYRDPDPTTAIHRESFTARLHLRGRES